MKEKLQNAIHIILKSRHDFTTEQVMSVVKGLESLLPEEKDSVKPEPAPEPKKK